MARLWRLVPLHKALRAATLALLAFAAAPAAAADRAGDFDFFVLALTWAPSYCANAARPDPAQCNLRRPGFVVHGLWPQFERGWPEYCETSMPQRLPASTVSGIADMLPSVSAANYQWRKHGMCAGLRPESYFALMRRAVEKVAIPEAYIAPATDLLAQPREVEAAFVVANPGLSERGIAITCNRDGVIEARICLSKRLDFRRCEEVDRGGCRHPVRLPVN